jgi:hypothetical protein
VRCWELAWAHLGQEHAVAQECVVEPEHVAEQERVHQEKGKMLNLLNAS